MILPEATKLRKISSYIFGEIAAAAVVTHESPLVYFISLLICVVFLPLLLFFGKYKKLQLEKLSWRGKSVFRQASFPFFMNKKCPLFRNKWGGHFSSSQRVAEMGYLKRNNLGTNYQQFKHNATQIF